MVDPRDEACRVCAEARANEETGCRVSCRKGRSVTPAMGATNSGFAKVKGPIFMRKRLRLKDETGEVVGIGLRRHAGASASLF